MANTLTISLYTDSATAVLRRDSDGRWRWFDTTNEDSDEAGSDMEISGATAFEAMENLIDAYGTLDIDGDMSDHLTAAASLDAATT